MKKISAFVLIQLTFLWATAQQYYLPEPKTANSIISHAAYSFEYSEAHEQALWVAYELSAAETVKSYDRSDNFKADELVSTGTANDSDYKGSGYDRGHLAPAADMSWSDLTMRESFLYSNISPQLPGFNRGVWKKLEAHVRQWANDYGSVLVATGPILSVPALHQIGPNQVTVPGAFYKAVAYKSEGVYHGIAFVLANESSSSSVSVFAITIDSLESLSGLNFFYQLPDEFEESMEASFDTKKWNWTTSRSYKSGKASTKTKAAGQCQGNTLKGQRCKNQTKNASGYCHYHLDQGNNTAAPAKGAASSVRCSGSTKAGARCKRKTSSTNGRCYQH